MVLQRSCIMLLITWEPRWDPEKSMHYKIYALLRYALWAYVLYDCPENEWFFDTKIKIHPDPINLSSWEFQFIQNTPFLTYSRYFCIDRTALQCAIHDSCVHRDSQAKLGNHTVALLSLRFVFRAFVNGVSRFECVRTLNAIVYWPRCRAWHTVTKLCISIAFSTPQLLLLPLQRIRNKIIKFLLGLVDRDLKYTAE